MSSKADSGNPCCGQRKAEEGQRHQRMPGGSAQGMSQRAELLEHCYEALELPGVPSDYHFIIQGCAGALWSRRRREPQALEDVERLCWLDIQLIEARPETIVYQHEDDPSFYRVLTFAILIDLYEREGCLREALEVAETAARHGQGPEARDRLAQRIAVVENEDRG